MRTKLHQDDIAFLATIPTSTDPKLAEWPDFEEVYFSVPADDDDAVNRGIRRSRAAREASPYQRGDVVVLNFGSTEEPDLRKCLILRVWSEYLERRMYYIPKYRVVWETKAGKWSHGFKYVWPGQIERGMKLFRGVSADDSE